MSHSSRNKPLHILIKPTVQKGLIILIPHSIIFILVICLSIFTIFTKIAFISLILASTYYYSRIYLLQSSKNVVISINQDTAQNWLLSIKNNNQNKSEQFTVDLLPSSFISEWLIILNFQGRGSSHYKAIFTPDSLSKKQFRRLYTKIKLTYIN